MVARTRGDIPTIRRRIELVAFLFAVVSFAYWFGMVLNEPPEAFRIDVFVYRGGVQAVLEGRPLYEPVYGPLYFVYPPFAALLFAPMAWMSDTLLSIVMITINLMLVIWTVAMVAREAGGAGSVITRGTAACLGIGYTFLLVPLADTLWLGQINVVLMALVVGDLVALNRGKRWAGVGIGIAAGIKLTPLLFVVLLLWTRRWRAAGVALGTFAVTVALGFILWRDAVAFWTHAMLDTARIAPSEWIVNQSLDGVLARFRPDAPGWVWFVGASVVCGLAIVLGGRLVDRDAPILAAGVVGAASAFAAPFSWEHHWIWLVILGWWPLCAAIVGFVHRDRRWPWWAFWAAFTLLLTMRYDRGGGHAIGVFAFGGPDNEQSLWTVAYPLGAALIIAGMVGAELVGRPSRTPRAPVGPGVAG